MFGKGQVETDAFLRTLGWRRVAQQEYDTKLVGRHQEVPPGLRRRASTPTSRARTARTSPWSTRPSASRNDYKPAEWTPVDSVAWLKAMAWDLRGNMQDEIDRSLMTSRLSHEADRGALPGVPVRPEQADRRSRAVDRAPVTGQVRRRTAEPSDGPRAARTGTSQRRDRGPEHPARRALRRPWTRSRRCSARTAAASAPTPGSSPASTRPPASRCSPTTRTWRRSCPRVWYQMGLHCRTVSRAVPVRRRRLHLLRACPA